MEIPQVPAPTIRMVEFKESGLDIVRICEDAPEGKKKFEVLNLSKRAVTYQLIRCFPTYTEMT